MKSVIRYLSIFILFMGAFNEPGCASDQELIQQRLERWQKISLNKTNRIVNNHSAQSIVVLSKSSNSFFTDMKVNDDNSPASFEQRMADAAYLPDGSLVVVWEDERNGDWDIYAQLLDDAGNPAGNNRRLIYDSNANSQRQSVIAVNNSGAILIIWTEEESASLYAQAFDGSLAQAGNRQKLNDNSDVTIVNLPAVAALGNGQFVVVWEDGRNGANIYGQVVQASGSPVGGNFMVNNNIVSDFRISPDVVADGGSNFAVVWEDYRSGEGDVYFRVFNSGGSPLTPEIIPIDPAYTGSFQFSPQVAFLTGTGYFVAWITDRNGGQDIYAQLISTSGSLINSNYQINNLVSDVCWDLSAKSAPDGSAGCAWSNLGVTAEIDIQLINNDGTTFGVNQPASDPMATGERGLPSIALSDGGYHVVWQDARNQHYDIYGQQFDADSGKVGLNIRQNDDAVGSQQIFPDLTGLPSGNAALVWQDKKNDRGDIYLQIVGPTGNYVGGSVKLNDDQYRNVQARPQLDAAAGDGSMVAVWEDTRAGSGLTGQNIFAQRINSSGGRVGSNFVVNDGSNGQNYDPDVAVGDDGRAVVVWLDQRNGRKDVFLQRYDAGGSATGGNLLVSGLAAASESYNPHVGISSDGRAVVSWISVIGGRRVGYFQVYNPDGSPYSGNTSIAVDTSLVDILDLDIFLQPATRELFVAYIDSSTDSTKIKLLRYNPTSYTIGGELLLSDSPNLNFRDIRITGDANDGLLVTWSDYRSSQRRVYLQFVRQDGTIMENNILASQMQAASMEKQPVAALDNGSYYCAWVDNRNLGFGFDIYVNSGYYNITNADDFNIVFPSEFKLHQNYPNPFNPVTTISYSIASTKCIKLEIFNLLGQCVKTLVDQPQSAGNYEIPWDATNGVGHPVASGVYFYRLTTGESTLTRKMTLLK